MDRLPAPALAAEPAPALPAPYHAGRIALSLAAARSYFAGRNRCGASAAYWRDCARAAIRDARAAARALDGFAAPLAPAAARPPRAPHAIKGQNAPAGRAGSKLGRKG